MTYSPAHPVSAQQQARGTRAVVGNITGAANNGSGLIRILLVAHKLKTGNLVKITGVGGTVEANAIWRITVTDGSHFDLVGSTFTNVYTSGGLALRMAS